MSNRIADPGVASHVDRMTTPDPITRLNAALASRFRIERELGGAGIRFVPAVDLADVGAGASSVGRRGRVLGRGRAVLLVGMTMAGAAACGDIVGPGEETLTIQPETVTFTSLGEVAQLNATIRTSDGSVVTGRSISWMSEDRAVATVSPDGLARSATGPIGTGSTRIIATSGELADTVPVTVNQTPARLEFQAGPQRAIVESPVAEEVSVLVLDAVGSRVHQATGSVTLSIGAGAGTLLGSVTQPIDYGRALFQDVAVSEAGSGVTIEASMTGVSTAESAPFDVLGFDAVSASDSYACAVERSGETMCWGRNRVGQLGDGTVDDSYRPTTVIGGVAFNVVSTGEEHTCALSGSSAYCWGRNNFGELGRGTTSLEEPEPAPVVGSLVFSQISAGARHTCGLAGGAAYCWGDDEWGQLGNGVGGASSEPVAVSGGLTFFSIDAGGLSTCGLVEGGTAYCWGHWLSNGNGSTTDQTEPVPVGGGLSFTSLEVGRGIVCGLVDGGTGYCWGENGNGQVGVGSLDDYVTAPTEVAGGHTFSAISPGYWLACGLTSDSEPLCWGSSFAGGLGAGDSSAPNAYEPVAVVGGHRFAAISTGKWSACGRTEAGGVVCWGRDISGNTRPTPVRLTLH